MDARTRLFRRIFLMQRTYFECVRTQLDGQSIHPRQGPVMTMLLHKDGASQADLVRELGVTAATVAVSISRLEKLGYVRRERNERNQRANVLMLTETGRMEAQKLEKALCEARNAALEGFSEDELTIIANYCERMLLNLREQYQLKEGKEPTCTRC